MINIRFYTLLPFFLLVFFSQDFERISVPAIQKDIIGCSPDGNEFPGGPAGGKFITVLPGWGKYSYTISSISDSGQLYFNQGLNMYYGYHKAESMASFKEAARFDSTNAMVYWGQALASGPSYNFSHGYRMKSTVPSIVEKMNSFVSDASAKEQDLIKAINTRYSADTTDSNRKKLNSDYAKSMQALVVKYPDDIDIKALYVDAVMMIHEWDFWNNDGTPKQWTPVLMNYCEDILKLDPKHPAALHYYIHVTEASRQPQVALPAADILKDIMPGVAHMVHMSSHEYERMGLYEKGVEVNEKADDNLVLYDSLTNHMMTSVHSSHYFAVESYCALSGGMYKRGMPKALRCRNSVAPDHEKTYQQYLYMFPELALVRLGKWDEILHSTHAPDNSWTYATQLYAFATGMAYANTGRPDLAVKQLKILRSKMNDDILKTRFSPYMSTPFEAASIAENILDASILFSENKYKSAVAAIKKAISVEDSLIYVEPKLWILPARQYLGAFYMRLDKPAEAEKIYREDLVWNPGSGWSLLGLYKSLIAQGKNKEAEKYKPAYMQSFSAADNIPPASVYLIRK